MENGRHLPPGSLEETMLLPLWSRATIADVLPVFRDAAAEKIIQRTGYDFTTFETAIHEYHKLVFAIRTGHFDTALRHYLALHPRATVVNIGAGLDTTFERVDNHTLRWYNLDLPEAIRFRTRFIPETPRSTCIARSVFDFRWFDEIEYSSARGLFLLAGGIFVYHRTPAVKALFHALAGHFNNAELVFDAVSDLGVRIGNRKMKRMGMSGPFWYFALGNPDRKIPKWSENIEIVDWFPLWKGIPRPTNCAKKTMLMMALNDLFGIEKIVHVRFRTGP